MKKLSKKIWEDGRIIDLWSLVQLIGGIFLGSILFKFNLSLTNAVLLAFILTLSWEVFELLTKRYEAPLNKLLDLFTGVLGVYLAYYILSLDLITNNTLLLISGVIFVILELWGFLATVDFTKINKANFTSK
jgi:uncharacterized membrane protein HdeD (DUF308 family)